MTHLTELSAQDVAIFQHTIVPRLPRLLQRVDCLLQILHALYHHGYTTFLRQNRAEFHREHYRSFLQTCLRGFLVLEEHIAMLSRLPPPAPASKRPPEGVSFKHFFDGPLANRQWHEKYDRPWTPTLIHQGHGGTPSDEDRFHITKYWNRCGMRYLMSILFPTDAIRRALAARHIDAAELGGNGLNIFRSNVTDALLALAARLHIAAPRTAAQTLIDDLCDTVGITDSQILFTQHVRIHDYNSEEECGEEEGGEEEGGEEEDGEDEDDAAPEQQDRKRKRSDDDDDGALIVDDQLQHPMPKRPFQPPAAAATVAEVLDVERVRLFQRYSDDWAQHHISLDSYSFMQSIVEGYTATTMPTEFTLAGIRQAFLLIGKLTDVANTYKQRMEQAAQLLRGDDQE